MKTILLWSKHVKPTPRTISFLVFWSVVESLCCILMPISFAKIISTATVQLFSKTNIWILINLFATIITIIIKNYIRLKIKHFENDLYSKMINCSCDCNSSSILANGISLLYSYLKFISRFSLITIFAFCLSLKMALIIIISVIVFNIINLLTRNKYFYFFEYVWPIVIASIFLISNNSLRLQEITNSTFLIISTFINNHLLKSEFILNNHQTSIKIKTLLENKTINFNETNKKQISTHTKKK